VHRHHGDPIGLPHPADERPCRFLHARREIDADGRVVEQEDDGPRRALRCHERDFFDRDAIAADPDFEFRGLEIADRCAITPDRDDVEGEAGGDGRRILRC
jgi:hypothetical protein